MCFFVFVACRSHVKLLYGKSLVFLGFMLVCACVSFVCGFILVWVSELYAHPENPGKMQYRICLIQTVLYLCTSFAVSIGWNDQDRTEKRKNIGKGCKAVSLSHCFNMYSSKIHDLMWVLRKHTYFPWFNESEKYWYEHNIFVCVHFLRLYLL